MELKIISRLIDLLNLFKINDRLISYYYLLNNLYHVLFSFIQCLSKHLIYQYTV